MKITVENRRRRLTIELPETDREIDVHGVRVPVDIIKAVRIGCRPGPAGVTATQCVSNPMERAERERI